MSPGSSVANWASAPVNSTGTPQLRPAGGQTWCNLSPHFLDSPYIRTFRLHTQSTCKANCGSAASLVILVLYDVSGPGAASQLSSGNFVHAARVVKCARVRLDISDCLTVFHHVAGRLGAGSRPANLCATRAARRSTISGRPDARRRVPSPSTRLPTAPSAFWVSDRASRGPEIGDPRSSGICGMWDEPGPPGQQETKPAARQRHRTAGMRRACHFIPQTRSDLYLCTDDGICFVCSALSDEIAAV